MMKQVVLVTILGCCLALPFLLQGCSEDNPGPEMTDEEILQSLVAGGSSDFAEWFDLESFLGEGTEGALREAPPMVLRAPIETVRWWREPQRPFIHDIDPDVVGDSAFVSAVTTINGTLHLLASDDGGEGSLIQYTKDMTDVATRYAVFRRHPDSTKYVGGWYLEKVSDVEVESASPARTLTPAAVLDSIVIRWEEGGEDQEHVVRDPLQLHTREETPRLPPTTWALVEVYHSDAETRAFLHTGRGNEHRRFRLTEGEDGVFRGAWLTPTLPGVYQGAVDLLTEGTLLDDTEPYDANAWLIIYRCGSPVPE